MDKLKTGTVLNHKERNTNIIVGKVIDGKVIDFRGKEIENPDDWQVIEPTTDTMAIIIESLNAYKAKTEVNEARLKKSLADANARLKDKSTGEQREVFANVIELQQLKTQLKKAEDELASARKDALQAENKKIADASKELLELRKENESLLKQRDSLKKELGAIKNPESRIRLNQNKIIQFHTITGVDAQVMDIEIATLLSDGWEIVNISDVPFTSIEGKEGKDKFQKHTTKRIVSFKRNNPHQPEARLHAEAKLDDAIEKALATKPNGSHIASLTSPTMADIAEIGFAPNQEANNSQSFFNHPPQ